jgi:hypothetical protein
LASTDRWQLLYVSDLFYIPTIFAAQLAVSLFFLRLSGPERSFFHRLARFIGGASMVFALVCFLMIAIRVEYGMHVWDIVVVGHKSIVSSQVFRSRVQMTDDITALSLDRNRCFKHDHRDSLDHLPCMAPLDFAHASEEEAGLCDLFQSPIPVSSLAKAAVIVANISER